MAFHDGAGHSQRHNIEALPGGRVARMTALEGAETSPELLGAYGIAKSGSTSEDDSPESRHVRNMPRRAGSLSSGSALGIGGIEDSSPGDTFSSPEGTGQSEQLNFFKDYYSQDEIRPGDLVSTLWAYQPRAQDEFELERGDMLKVVGIWDDGWATGVRVPMNAEDWRDDRQLQRDSGLDNESSGDTSPDSDSDVKAFPLVCICLPQHWRKTIEGDSTEGSGMPDMSHFS